MFSRTLYQQKRQISFKLLVIQTKYRVNDVLRSLKNIKIDKAEVQIETLKSNTTNTAERFRLPKFALGTSKLRFDKLPSVKIDRTKLSKVVIPSKVVNLSDRVAIYSFKSLLYVPRLVGTGIERILLIDFPGKFVISIFDKMKYPVIVVNRAVSSITLPTRLKGTIVEKWADYWKNLSHDYYEVYRDAVKGFRDNPKRSAVLTSVAGLITALFLTNPDEVSFRDHFLKHCNELSMIGEQVQNVDSVEYVRNVERYYNQDTIRRISLGLFSLVYVQEYHDTVGLYKSQCQYLQPRYLSLHEKIIDIGFFNTWWNMERNMIDYDINPNEWKHK